MNVAVIGAGITGLTTCRALLALGHQVSLIDAAQSVANGASAQNGGQLSYAYVAPLAAPALLKKIPSLLFSRDSPLSIRFSLSRAFVVWSAQFLKSCTQQRLEIGTSALLDLAELSREITDPWLDSIDTKRIDHKRNGKLVLFPDVKSLSEAKGQVALQARLGSEQAVLSASECVEIEPALRNYSSKFVGGVYTRTDEVADCKKVCDLLIDSLKQSRNFEYRSNTIVTTFNWHGDRITSAVAQNEDALLGLQMDAYVLCASVGTPHLLQNLGVKMPILPLKGYSMDVARAELENYPTLSVTDTASKVVFAPLGEGDDARLRVAGFAQLNTFDNKPDHRKISALESNVREIFGAANGRIQSTHPWGGLRPMTPSSMPYIGRTKRWSNLYVNAGQGALGFTLAFGSAQLVADILSNKPTRISRSLFARHPLALI